MIKRTQHGQALTEFIVVAAFVLVPLFLIIPLLAKVISQKQSVELGARYAAWERTVWYEEAPDSGLSGYQGAELTFKSDEVVAREIDERIFSKDTQPVQSSSGKWGGELSAFSYRQNGNTKSLLADSSGDGYAAVSTNNNAPEEAVLSTIDSFAVVLDYVLKFDVPRKGLYTATNEVDLIDLSGVFGSDLGVESLSLNASNTLYTESWAAGGREHAENRVSGLLWTNYLNNSVFNTVQDILAFFPMFNELDSDCLIFGYTTIEPLPEHRLAEYDGIEGGGGTSCSM